MTQAGQVTNRWRSGTGSPAACDATPAAVLPLVPKPSSARPRLGKRRRGTASAAPRGPRHFLPWILWELAGAAGLSPGRGECQGEERRRNVQEAATHHVGVSLPGPPFPAHVNRHHVRERLRSLSGLAHDPVGGKGRSAVLPPLQSRGAQPMAASSSSSSSTLCPTPATGVGRAAPATLCLEEGTHVPPAPGHRPAPAPGPNVPGGPRMAGGSGATGTGRGHEGDRDRQGTRRGQGFPPQHSRLGDEVSVGQRRALHAAYPDGTQDVAEASAQVPPADGQQGAPLQRPTQRLDLQHQGRRWRRTMGKPLASTPQPAPASHSAARAEGRAAPDAPAPPRLSTRMPPWLQFGKREAITGSGARVWPRMTPAASTPGANTPSHHSFRRSWGRDKPGGSEAQRRGAGVPGRGSYHHACKGCPEHSGAFQDKSKTKSVPMHGAWPRRQRCGTPGCRTSLALREEKAAPHPPPTPAVFHLGAADPAAARGQGAGHGAAPPRGQHGRVIPSGSEMGLFPSQRRGHTQPGRHAMRHQLARPAGPSAPTARLRAPRRLLRRPPLQEGSARACVLA